MSGSEEKTQAASPRKLRKARERGQIPMQRDTRLFAVTLAGLIYLWLTAPSFIDFFQDAMTAAITAIDAPEVSADLQLAQALTETQRLIGLLIAVLFGVTFVTSILLNKGFVFSPDTLTPKMSNLDPVSGIKKIFGVRALVEIAKSLLKIGLGGGAVYLILAGAVGSVVNAAQCGVTCLLELTVVLGLLIVGVILILALAFSAVDIPIQTWLFQRQVKMTHSEVKREQKDQHGTPEVRRERHRLRREASRSSARTGLKYANFVVFSQERAIAMRYVKSESRVPIIVARGSGETLDTFLETARQIGARHYRDDRLAAQLHETGRPGKPIPERLFPDVASVLLALNMS